MNAARAVFLLVVVAALGADVGRHLPPEVEPLVGPAYSDSFTVACASTPTLIQAPSQYSYGCQNDSTTMVAVGDSTIGDPTDARNSPVYCKTNCAKREWGGNFRLEYCRADTGTVTIYCRALVNTTSAPRRAPDAHRHRRRHRRRRMRAG